MNEHNQMELAGFHSFLKRSSDGPWNTFYPNKLDVVLKKVRPHFRFSWSNKKLKYFNVPCSFDIETSSFYENGNKRACMYAWCFGIYGVVIRGRTWEDFINLMIGLSDRLNLSEEKRLIVYVRNLAYDFQFFRKYFVFSNVFALRDLVPIYAVSDLGIEFRCSYILTGYSLETSGKNLQKYKVEKAVGDLDYSLIRHQKTPLSDREWIYIIKDVCVDMAVIAEKIETEGGIAKIPLTKTGYVRRSCRNACFYEPGIPRKKSVKRLRYLDKMKELVLTPEEYNMLRDAFQGGFTHANPFYADQTITDTVTSMDFTSSYPTVLVSEQFPMSAGEFIHIKSREELEHDLKYYCCLFEIEIEGLYSKVLFDNYISKSKCRCLENPDVANGRVVSADRLRITVTGEDFKIMEKMYGWKHLRIGKFIRYKKGYLPTDLVKSILDFYRVKTELKGVVGKEAEYLNGKENVNSVYGMTVTSIVHPDIIYTDEWQPSQEKSLEEAIEKYNKSRSRFLFYPWGVWVTAYARRNLFSGILSVGDDYLYADTDSIKFLNYEKHKQYFDKYNATILQQLKTACDYHNIDYNAIAPKTIKGVQKPLGVWDFDGAYSRFKTLGAKRYLVEYADVPENGKDKGKIKSTIAGLSKSNGINYLLKTYGRDGVFDAFKDGMIVPAGSTGKMTHYYCHDEIEGIVTDWTGTPGKYHEKSYIHLEPCAFHLDMHGYLDYILSLREEDYI